MRTEALLVCSLVHSHVSPLIVDSLFLVYLVSDEGTIRTLISLQGSGLGCLVRTNVSFVQGRRSPHGKPGQSSPRGWGAWCVLFCLSGETTRKLLLAGGGLQVAVTLSCQVGVSRGAVSLICQGGDAVSPSCLGGLRFASCRHSKLPGRGCWMSFAFRFGCGVG